MGQLCTSLRVSAHLQVVGQCGGVDRLTLCLPRNGKKGRRRLVGAFTFPTAGSRAGTHSSAQRISLRVGKLSKKDGATPVRMDFLAGSCLVARLEIPLGDLLADLKASTEGRRSSLFLSLEGHLAEDSGGAPGSRGPSPVAAYHSRRPLEEPRPHQHEQKETHKPEQKANLPQQPSEINYSLPSPPHETKPSLSPQAGQSKPSLPPQAGRSKPSLPPQASQSKPSLSPQAGQSKPSLSPQASQSKPSLSPQASQSKPSLSPQAGQSKPSLSPQAGENASPPVQQVIHRDLGEGEKWVPPQAHLRQKTAHQAGETVPSLSPEVIHRDLGEGERWRPPQALLRQRRGEPSGSSSAGERDGLVMQPPIPSPSKQGKEAPPGEKGVGGSRLCGPCLVDRLLQCAQAVSLALFTYKVCIECF